MERDFDDEKRRALFLEQKKSGTVHVGKKSDVTIHAHAEAVRNTNTAAEDSPPYLNCKKYFTDRRKGYRNDPSQNDEEKSSIRKSHREEGVWCEHSG